MDCNAIVVPYVGSITFIFFLLIPSCLALEPTNQTISPVALPTSGQLPLKENNNTDTGDIILTSPSLSAPMSIDAGPSVPAPHTHHHREILTSPKPRGKSLAIIIASMLVAFFLMGIFSVYIRRCRVPETSQRNLHTGSNYGHSRSFYNGNLSFPFAARQQLLSGEGNCPQQHGLDLLLVSSLPTLKFSRGKGFEGFEAVETGRMVAECAVCLNEFEEGEELRYLPKCGHSFHQECIDMWLLLHTTCPLCRRSLLYDMNDHARPTMSNESIADSASPQALNRDVHEPLSDVQPLGYLADSRRTGVVSPLDRHDVTRLPQYRMRRSHSTGHYLYMYPPPPSSSQWIDLQCRNQLDILQATINAQGPKTSYATSSRPPPHNKLGCATWFRPRPGSESGRAACIRPFIGSQSGDAGWSRPMLDSELECATWNRPMPGNKLGRATENGVMSGNDSNCATWSPPAPYHKAHSCNVLLDLQAMRRELQDASPNRPTIGSQSGDAGWSRPMLDSELDGATWSRPMPGNKLGRATQNGAMSGNKSSCATTCSPPLPYHKAHSCNVLLDLKATRRILQDASPKRPMLGSHLGDAGWNRSILGSESNRAAWIQPIPVGNKAGCTTWSRLMPAGNKSAHAKQNGAMSGNESSCATWSSPAPYHKAHSCNVLLDLQAMRKALQDASPS